jgi:hypothetical protein
MDMLHIDTSRPGGDLEMMKTPDYWPLGPVLPLINPRLRDPQNIMADCGVMVCKPGYPRTRVWLLNMHDVRLRTLMSQPASDEAQAIPHKDYDSFEEVIADGWRVN